MNPTSTPTKDTRDKRDTSPKTRRIKRITTILYTLALQHAQHQAAAAAKHTTRSSRRAHLATIAALPLAAIAPQHLTPHQLHQHATTALAAAAAPAPVPSTPLPVPLAAYPDRFVLSLARFLLAYDTTAQGWWDEAQLSVPRAADAARARRLLDAQLSSYGASVAYGLRAYDEPAGVAALWARLAAAYGGQPDGMRQLALVFSALPPETQPVSLIREALGGAPLPAAAPAAAALVAEPASPLLSQLPPASLAPLWDASRGCFTLPPALAASAALGAVPITREAPLSLSTYGRFALSGALGCMATHLAVVPLDVVKTRMQTRPGAYASLADAFATIRRDEGASMLLQGAGATAMGYFTYGVTVYPGYELAKRGLFALAGASGVAEARVPLVLLAGALATIVTCFAIAPFEAVRIRMVESPAYAPSAVAALERYMGEGGVAALYDGLLPLLARQVLFGMVKFLVFDYAADAIAAALPPGAAQGFAATAAISLASGAVAGVAAACVSQPADVVLSKVAQGGGDAPQGELRGPINQVGLILDTARSQLRLYGPGGLYLGLGSRCAWSGAIIAGQFFLYDVFKSALHVTHDDLVFVYDALGAALEGALATS